MLTKKLSNGTFCMVRCCFPEFPRRPSRRITLSLHYMEKAFIKKEKSGTLLNGLNDDDLRVFHLCRGWDFILFHDIAHLLARFSVLDEDWRFPRFAVLEDHGGFRSICVLYDHGGFCSVGVLYDHLRLCRLLDDEWSFLGQKGCFHLDFVILRIDEGGAHPCNQALVVDGDVESTWLCFCSLLLVRKNCKGLIYILINHFHEIECYFLNRKCIKASQ